MIPIVGLWGREVVRSVIAVERYIAERSAVSSASRNE